LLLFSDFIKTCVLVLFFILRLTIPNFIFCLLVGDSVYVQKICLANWFCVGQVESQFIVLDLKLSGLEVAGSVYAQNLSLTKWFRLDKF